MQEETLENNLEKGECLMDHDQNQEITSPEKIKDATYQVQETSFSDYKQNSIPVLLQIDTLSSKIQVLREKQKVLSDEVKGLTDESFLGFEVLSSLRYLGSEYETLKKKYAKECLERKRLYNEVIELKGNIRVFCRCRPLNQNEISNGCSSVVEFNSSEETELQIVCADSSKKQFKFDHVFSPQDDQEAVFAQTSPLVTSVLDGFNVCIFAYGQTGTGKTFTMEGTPGSRGVNYRTLEELFRISKERSGSMKYELFVSMLEVYNEKIRDLLADNFNQGVKKLDIKQAADGSQEVPGLHEACVHSVDNVWEQLKTGSQNRAVGSTAINELSSRSHCLLRVTVKGENLVNGQRTRSHLWFVDLAGSERIGRTEVDGERLKESQFINKSLSALGDVISALASKTTHVPYRNSKLTHLLQSSLGGDCKTLMFVQISPSSADLGETLCSLNFASRVRAVEHGPAHKQGDHYELSKYKQMAEKQKHQDEKEIMKLQNSLQALQLRFATQEQHYRSLQGKVRDLENKLAEEGKEKARIQMENRASKSSSSFLYQNKEDAEKKPPMPMPIAPSRLRPPLRGITNLPSVPEMFPFKKPNSTSREENNSTTKTLMQPRRVSLRPPQATKQVQQPRRRASIATLRPEPQLLSSTKPGTNSSARALFRQPKRRVSIATSRPESQSSTLRQPKRRVSIATARPESQFSSTVTPQNAGNTSFMDRLAMAREARRISKLFSPMPDLGGSTAAEEVTPGNRASRIPTLQLGSWKPTHPTVVALHKRHFVWSPLKQKVEKKERKLSSSSLSSRFSDYWK